MEAQSSPEYVAGSWSFFCNCHLPLIILLFLWERKRKRMAPEWSPSSSLKTHTHNDEGQERISDHTQGCKYLSPSSSSPPSSSSKHCKIRAPSFWPDSLVSLLQIGKLRPRVGHLLGSHSKLLVQQEAALSPWIAVSSPSSPPLACPGSGPGTQSRPGRAQERSEQRLEQFGAVGAETGAFSALALCLLLCDGKCCS